MFRWNYLVDCIHMQSVCSLSARAQFNQSRQLSNSQDGCQTNSRRYDDLLFITSAEEGGYVFGSVCLSVCLSVGLLANL